MAGLVALLAVPAFNTTNIGHMHTSQIIAHADTLPPNYKGQATTNNAATATRTQGNGQPISDEPETINIPAGTSVNVEGEVGAHGYLVTIPNKIGTYVLPGGRGGAFDGTTSASNNQNNTSSNNNQNNNQSDTQYNNTNSLPQTSEVHATKKIMAAASALLAIGMGASALDLINKYQKKGTAAHAYAYNVPVINGSNNDNEMTKTIEEINHNLDIFHSNHPDYE